MAIARNISINDETYELEPSKGQRVYVGTCSTAAATNPKVCTVEDFPVDENNKPYTGTEIVVKFTATNSSTSTTPQLNVNGTGAIRIWYNNAVLASAKSAYAGYANRYLHYVYDGTYWVFMGHSVDNNSTYSNVALGQGYAVQNNSAASATITAALGSYALTVNGIVSVKFTYDVPANATLNINSKGAKAIYNKDAAITSGVIKAGDTATFIYNTYYRLISVDRWQDKQDALVSGTNLKTVNSTSLLGSGNVSVQPTLVSGTNIKTINNESLLGSGNISIQGGSGSGDNHVYNQSRNALVISSTTYTVTREGSVTSAVVYDRNKNPITFPFQVTQGDELYVAVSVVSLVTFTMGGSSYNPDTRGSESSTGRIYYIIYKVTGDVLVSINAVSGGGAND